MALSGATVTWRGIVFSGDGDATYKFESLEGWESSPPTSSSASARPGRHGVMDAPTLAGERIVTLGGWLQSPNRDMLLTALVNEMWLADPESPPEPLTISHMGRTLTTDAHLDRFTADGEAGRWGDGEVGFAAQWRCPDPLRYGVTVNVSTGFPLQTGGLEFDLFTDGAGVDVGWLEFGAAGSTGRVTVDNPGTAPVWPQFRVQGPTPAFEIVCVETGERLVFSRALGAGEALLLDSATGLVGLGESAVDYSGSLTRSEWFAVPRQGSRTIMFLPLGASDSGSLTVIHRSAWW